MGSRVVVWDERRDGYEEGHVLEEDLQARRVLAEGLVCALPVDRELLARGPVSGFFARKWGEGVELRRLSQVRVCPMLLHVHPDFRFIHWAAMVIPLRTAADVRGSLRLASASYGASAFVGGLAATAEAVDLGAVARHRPRLPSGGWVVGGRSEVSCAVEGYMGLELQAQADGCLVVWSAVSQCSRPE